MVKDVICGGGLCPYVPCKKYPNCKHIRDFREELDAERAGKRNNGK